MKSYEKLNFCATFCLRSSLLSMIVACTSFFAGCSTAPPASSGPKTASAEIQVDAVVKATNEALAAILGESTSADCSNREIAADRLTFSDNCRFDKRLSASLLDGRERVQVFPASDKRMDIEEIPLRLSMWLVKVDQRTSPPAGMVISCPEKSNEVGLEVVPVLIQTYKILAPFVRKWLTYRPVESYNVVVLVKDDGRTVASINFVKTSVVISQARCMKGVGYIESADSL